ncbi:MAG: NAD(P)/FAD-dependent oxidoreductase [Cyanobacteriota bacterium]|nr:NAD(P)/FAD-dependent oxidoreductase [Cyanobacteriota bacterium]
MSLANNQHNPTSAVLVVGAGAAGVAAAHRLQAAGETVVVLEARHRLGGRVWTDEQFANFPVELGAEFIHGEQAPTHLLLKESGLQGIPVSLKPNLWWSEAGQAARPIPDLSPACQSIWQGLQADYQHLLNSHLNEDDSLGNYLRTRGWQGEALGMADVLLAQTCCAPLDSLSCQDLIREAQVDQAGAGEARIAEGYHRLLTYLARDLSIDYGQVVQGIHCSSSRVQIHTAQQDYQGKACIVTVPVSLLQGSTIRFDPPLSPEKRRAIQSFRIEPSSKLIYRFRQHLWPDSLTLMAHQGLVARWWTPAYARSGADAVIASHITAQRAHHIDRLPLATALALGLRDLSLLLGISMAHLQAECLDARRLSWGADPYTLGGYAHIPPGQAEARVVLAQPEGSRLFFAGEATAYDSNPQTVHGAMVSGWRAAQSCLEAVG